MDDEIAKLRQALAEQERLREAAENRALDERRQREAEQCRREEAEQLARPARPQTLMSYLEACRSLNLAIQVVTDRSLTTKGDTTNPAGRVYPKRIIPWDDFPAR